MTLYDMLDKTKYYQQVWIFETNAYDQNMPLFKGTVQDARRDTDRMGNASLIGVKCTKCGGAYMTSDKDKCPNDVFRAWNQRVGEVTVNQYGDGSKVFGHVDTLTINY